jgi:PAS domain S-box-containing protein
MLTPLRILIVEDSLTDTELMLYELHSSGIKADWQRVDTEPDYLAQLSGDFDVIISDFNMPQFDALRALQLLQSRGLDIPFIIITGSISEEVAVECMKQGAADYLLKDRLVRLGQAVMHAVQQKKLHDEKRQAESALKESEERFRRLADNAQDIIYRYRLTPPRGFEYVSPAATAITGYTPEEFYADPKLGFKISHADDRRRVLQQSIAGEGQTQPIVLRWIRKDGAIIWTEHSNLAIYNEAGLIAIEGIARDITKRKQAEIQLQQQAERDRLLGAIALRIRQSLNLAEILNTTVEEVRQFLQADRVMIYRFDANQDGVLVAESVAFNRTLDSAINIHRICLQQTQAESKQEQVQTVNDINQAGLTPNSVELMTQLQVRAKLMVPIFQDDHQWGLLAVEQYSQPRQWQPIEIDLLERLATQVAIAIQQAQLFNRVQQQADREQLLNQISQALNSSLDPAHILQEIVNLVGKGFGVSRVNIFSINDLTIRVLNEWRKSDQVVSLLDWQASLSEHPELLDPNSNFSLHRAFHAPNYAAIPLRRKRLARSKEAQSLSVLRVPIFIGTLLFGGLSLQTTTTQRTFTAEEIHLLQRIADQAAIALYNAQSYERLEQLVKERTEELEQEKVISEAANLAKTEFLTNMSHELRTPLTSILGFSKLLLQQIFGSLNEKQQQYIERISASGEYLLALINDLLDLSKIEAGKEELTLATIQVKDICQECISLIQELANRRGLEVVLVIKPEVRTCVADQRRLKQILFNLLSNAVKFTETGSVTLKVTKTEASIMFSVIDTGIGISEVDQAFLFQPFRQLNSNLARKYQGTGLGLALSRSLAQLHGGDITLKSELGGGSCFTFSLPAHPKRSEGLGVRGSSRAEVSSVEGTGVQGSGNPLDAKAGD